MEVETMANKVNKASLTVNYDKNLNLQKTTTPTVQTQQNNVVQPAVIDTTYQNNAGTLYGGHDSSWWQQQYSSQPDAESKNMVRKAADYYGYKIDDGVAKSNSVGTYGEYAKASVASNQGVTSTTQTYASNSPQVAALNAQSQTQEGQTTPVQTDSAPIDSYEEFLRKRGETYQENLDKQKALIEEQKQSAIEQAELQRQQTEQNAENERQRSVIDARSSYEQNKATYGAQAETLADMGLTGSGYGDYINAQAYANQRAGTQSANANAEATKNNAKYVADNAKLEIEQSANQSVLSAETTYAENMANNDSAIAQYRQQKEEEKKSAYSELLSYANNGSYDSEQLKSLGEKYGLSEEDITSLTDAAATYKNNTYKENYATALDNIAQYGTELDDSYLDNMYKMDLISEEQYNDLKKQLGDKIQQNINESISSSDSTSESIQANIDNVEKYYSEGKITTEQRQSIYKNYVTNSVTGVMEKDYGSNYTQKLTDCINANKEIDELYNAGKLSKSDYDSIKQTLNSQNANTCSGGWYVQGLGSGRENDDIDITIGGTSRNKKTEYDLLCGAKIGDETLIKELNRIATGDSNKTPAAGGDWAWLTGDKANSKETTGKLIVAYGNMYIYTHYGWRVVKNDNDKVSLKNAINAYLGK